MDTIPDSDPNEVSATIDKKTGLFYLVAYDGSEHAQAAISLLLDMPGASKISPASCKLTLMGVLPTQWIGNHELIQAALNKEEQRLKSAGFQVQTILRAGNPAATLNEHALESGSDLIVIGAKGLRSALGVLLGGVAQQVVEYSCCPVLVVRAPYNGLKRVLIVIDGSEPARKAVEYLAPSCPDGARRRCSWLPLSAQVKAMHVLPPPIIGETILRTWALGPEALYPAPIPPIDKDALEAAEEQTGERILAETLGILKQGGIEAESLLVRGDAADEIIQTVQQRAIDLVVCGSRGLSAVTGWLLGSVSRKLVHYAGCSALIVK
jgi:nucleotide-binding universal stress UspA family protein